MKIRHPHRNQRQNSIANDGGDTVLSKVGTVIRTSQLVFVEPEIL